MEARILSLLSFVSILVTSQCQQEIHQTPALGSRGSQASCYNELRLPQRCIPEFENAAFNVLMEATNTCGDSGTITYCIQTGTLTRKSCENCTAGQFQSYFLTDTHQDGENETWWQSETMYEGVQYPNQVNLTLHLGKAFDITYVRLVFHSPRPDSFAIYKKTKQDNNWEPYQYYSAACREFYGLPDSNSASRGAETRALCTSEYSDISPLRGGSVPFSTLEGRPSAYSFDTSAELQEWVTSTDIRITLDKLNTFGDELFAGKQVLQSYWYAISDVAVGARCKCNGHASKCDFVYGPNRQRRRMCQCQHNTDGPDCEKCLDFYNDAPWGRATQHNAHECKPCNCNGYSNRCRFDQDLYDRTGHGGFCLDCSENRDGPNCERCKENFYQRKDNLCVDCQCNPIGSRSLQCNSEGKCQCKPGVTGDKCDICAPNHYELTTLGCKSCGCHEAGSRNNTSNCDPTTGVCLCKDHVEGKRCRQCKPGYFNLDFENDFGCTPCFCFGHSAECQPATGYAKFTIESNFARSNEKWTAQDSSYNTIGLRYNGITQNIAVGGVGRETIYFVVPDQYLGDQRASYNHYLKFSLSIGEQSASDISAGVVLEGAGTYVTIRILGQQNPMPSVKANEYSFRLHENPEYEWSPKLSARAFMSILSNLTAIKIRGTYNPQGIGFLDSVRLESATRGAVGKPAMWVEHCSCPPGYVGQFCESCAPGYRHSPARGGPFMPCVPCDCNGHANFCDSETGSCICQHNTAGDNCELCARGYYGNAVTGTPYDCTPCPCPNNGPCRLMGDDIQCTECPTGYIGSKCDLCADGFFGDPTGLYGPVQICKPCDCNMNIDTNAVGNCNRTTGECLKCIYNTGGAHCDQCLPGHYGDALASKKGDCHACDCGGIGALRTEDGIPRCDPLDGRCACAEHVSGKSCNKCEDGYFGLTSEGCRTCDCDPNGSFNMTCNAVSGQCFCKQGVTGLKCDKCKVNHYGFSTKGCKECNCDKIGSRGLQCDSSGQCPCYENVEGIHCDRCKENKRDKQRGCVDCPQCYNLVQDAVNIHREKLLKLKKLLSDIERNPTVVSDGDFDNQLEDVKKEINVLLEKAEQGSGVSDGGKSLGTRLEELNKRLESIRDLLEKVDASTNGIVNSANKAASNIKISSERIEASRKELEDAYEYLNSDGAAALAKAQNRSEQFGQQSTQMSVIAQESRLIAEKLEKEAENIRNIAETAHKTSSDVYKLAKDGLGKQSNISAELRALRNEIKAAESKINSVQAMATQSLKRSSTVFNDALELYAKINSTVIPKIDDKLMKQADVVVAAANEMQEKIDKLMENNKLMLDNLADQVEKSRDILARGIEQQANLSELLSKLDEIHEKALKAVEQGNATLAEAQAINNTLKQFHNKVQTSKNEADAALTEIPVIDGHITQAKEMLYNVENDLKTASDNAKDARDTANEAHHKYAKQASEEASAIREKAAMTKSEAALLHNEAVQLTNRVVETAVKIDLLERSAEENAQLTGDAKEKVGQARTDAAESKKLVNKALKDVNIIVNELMNLPTLEDNALDRLERNLLEAEKELNATNLSSHIQMLQETKALHQRWIKEYQDEVKLLQLQVENVREIRDVLPSTCFKRLKLEPSK